MGVPSIVPVDESKASPCGNVPSIEKRVSSPRKEGTKLYLLPFARLYLALGYVKPETLVRARKANQQEADPTALDAIMVTTFRSMQLVATPIIIPVVSMNSRPSGRLP